MRYIIIVGDGIQFHTDKEPDLERSEPGVIRFKNGTVCKIDNPNPARLSVVKRGDADYTVEPGRDCKIIDLTRPSGTHAESGSAVVDIHGGQGFSVGDHATARNTFN